MKLNIDAINDLIKERFRGNKAWFSEEIGICKMYTYEILNGKRTQCSPKACQGLIDYCKRNKLDYKKYIII